MESQSQRKYKIFLAISTILRISFIQRSQGRTKIKEEERLGNVTKCYLRTNKQNGIQGGR